MEHRLSTTTLQHTSSGPLNLLPYTANSLYLGIHLPDVFCLHLFIRPHNRGNRGFFFKVVIFVVGIFLDTLNFKVFSSRANMFYKCWSYKAIFLNWFQQMMPKLLTVRSNSKIFIVAHQSGNFTPVLKYNVSNNVGNWHHHPIKTYTS